MNPIRCRVGQFFGALVAGVSPPDPTPARDVLPPGLYEAFERMPPVDRRHALAVLRALRSTGDVDDVLAQAALLHDVGKADAGIQVVHRVARVLLRRSVPLLWRYLSGCPTGWRRPYWVVANHPERGAVWIESLGGAREVVALIRYHEAEPPGDWAGSPQGRRHAALAAADANH